MHERAGTPATHDDLIDVAHLVTSYYSMRPDPDELSQQVTFGTSGHRGSSLDTAFNELHIAATTRAIVDYRQINRIGGPLFIGRDSHALSEPAWVTALEVLAAEGITVMIDSHDRYTPTPAISHGSAIRFIGQSLARISNHSSGDRPSRGPTSAATAFTISVKVLPGQTALAVAP